jgi:hypothetical protein
MRGYLANLLYPCRASATVYASRASWLERWPRSTVHLLPTGKGYALRSPTRGEKFPPYLPFGPAPRLGEVRPPR